MKNYGKTPWYRKSSSCCIAGNADDAETRPQIQFLSLRNAEAGLGARSILRKRGNMGPAPRTQDSAVDVAAQSAIYPAHYSELARGESGRDSFPVVLCQNISTGALHGGPPYRNRFAC